jgi:hypothetical protein
VGVGGQFHAPAALPAGKRPGTHCIGGWVGPRAGPYAKLHSSQSSNTIILKHNHWIWPRKYGLRTVQEARLWRNFVLHYILHKIKRRKANWIGHILRRNCLLKHVIEGKLEGRIEMTGRWGRRRKQLLDDLKETQKILEIERGSTRSHPMENSLWKRLRTCRKTDYRTKWILW